MHKLDGQIQEVNGWINGAERKMNEIDSQGPSDVLKVILFIYFEAFFPKTNVSFMPLVKTVYTPNICVLGPAGATCRAGTHQRKDGGGKVSGARVNVHQGGQLPGPGQTQAGAA